MPAHPAPPEPAPTPRPLTDEAIDAVGDWFRFAARDLPWRDPAASPWGILVSEIMLQQTPVVRVLPRWISWMERWPDAPSLAAASTADVLRAWDRLGYPRRALRLQDCARAIARDHAGLVPGDVEQLRALPGIGEYTAAAVAAFAFGRRAAVADTNIRRVLVRSVLGLERPSPSYTAAERALVTDALPEDTSRSVLWNQSVMELGALVCTARSPRCEDCPLSQHCLWLDRGRPAQHPSSPRRTQRFEGTDRQLRGMMMARLRGQDAAEEAELLSLDPVDGDRSRRCLDSLLADGLAVRDGTLIRLPA